MLRLPILLIFVCVLLSACSTPEPAINVESLDALSVSELERFPQAGVCYGLSNQLGFLDTSDNGVVSIKQDDNRAPGRLFQFVEVPIQADVYRQYRILSCKEGRGALDSSPFLEGYAKVRWVIDTDSSSLDKLWNLWPQEDGSYAIRNVEAGRGFLTASFPDVPVDKADLSAQVGLRPRETVRYATTQFNDAFRWYPYK